MLALHSSLENSVVTTGLEKVSFQSSPKELYIFTLLIQLIGRMQNAKLDKAQSGIKIARRNINNLRYADNITLIADNEELWSLLMKVKRESEKIGWKLNIKTTKITASILITSFANRMGRKYRRNDLFYFLGLQNYCGCSHEIQRHSLLERKALPKLHSIL